RSARHWSGPPPRWSPTRNSPKAKTCSFRRHDPAAYDPASAGSLLLSFRNPSPSVAGRPLRVSKGGGLRRRRRPGDMERKGLPATEGPGDPIPHSLPPRYAGGMTQPRPTAHKADVPADEAVPGYMRELEQATDYLDDDQRKVLRRAWAAGAEAHEGQARRAGEPYITHPVAVAKALAELKVDLETLVAAILHDTIEDTPLTREALAGGFGETVAELVDGVTKLDKLQFSSRQEATAESFRKMMLAMARDLRVILIKLGDRLHNMRTLGAQTGDARERIARETLEIYAPIAQRLGMNAMKEELQDLGFR